MKYLLNLHQTNQAIDISAKQNEKELTEKVQAAFRKYTNGTAKDYRNADKLCYLDWIRERLHINFGEYVKELINNKIDSE